jgi:hypothetical protein
MTANTEEHAHPGKESLHPTTQVVEASTLDGPNQYDDTTQHMYARLPALALHSHRVYEHGNAPDAQMVE